MSEFQKSLNRIARISKQADYDRARTELCELLQRWPENSFLWRLKAELIQLSDRKDVPLECAQEALQRSSELDPESPQAFVELGHFLFAVAGNSRVAVEHFDRAIALAQDCLLDALQGKAKAMADLGRREEALGYLAQAYWLQTHGNGQNGRGKKILQSLEELRTSD